MYAIVEISGKQFRVENNMKLRVPLQDSKPGEKIGFDRVLLIEDEKGNTTFGNPLVKNTQVAATVLEHGRDKKVIVFKKKRRKGYQKKNGHRQDFSLIEITSIGTPTIKKVTSAAKSTSPKPTEVKDTTITKKEVKTTKETSAKKTTRTTAKKSTVSKTAKTEVKAAKATPKVASKKSEEKKATKKPAAKKETKEN